MRRARSLLSVGLVLVACGGNDRDDSAPSPTAITEYNFIEQLSNAWCDPMGPCCSKYSVPFDLAQCRADLRIALKNRYDDINESGTLGPFDPAAATRCIAAVRRLVSACDASAAQPLDLKDVRTRQNGACSRVYEAAAQLGQECTSDRECISVEGRDPICTNVCRDVSVVADGEGCNPSPTSDNRSGVVFLCGDASSCEQLSGSPAAVCRPKSPFNDNGLPDGAPCQEDKDCHSNRCFKDACFTEKMALRPQQCATPVIYD